MGPRLAEIARTGFSFYPVCILTPPPQSPPTPKKKQKTREINKFFGKKTPRPFFYAAGFLGIGTYPRTSVSEPFSASNVSSFWEVL